MKEGVGRVGKVEGRNYCREVREEEEVMEKMERSLRIIGRRKGKK